MARFVVDDLPPALAAHVARAARLTFPKQGNTSDVAFAAHDGQVVVVKRCAHVVYLEWLRRERHVLAALAGLGLPVPKVIAYAEDESRSAPVGWLLMTQLPGRPLLTALREEPCAAHPALLRTLTRSSPRDHIALALQTKPEVELTRDSLEAFYCGYGAEPVDAATLDWFVRLYDYF